MLVVMFNVVPTPDVSQTITTVLVSVKMDLLATH